VCAEVAEEPAATIIRAMEVGSRQDRTAELRWMSSLSSADVCMHLGREVLYALGLKEAVKSTM